MNRRAALGLFGLAGLGITTGTMAAARGEQPASPLWIADISNWQPCIDPRRIVAEGFGVVVCKATEGTTYSDRHFDGFIPAVQEAGAIPGGYHYLRARDGAGQARHFFKRLKRHGGPKGWIIQLDCESDGLAKEIRAWTAEWTQLSEGHPFLIYTGSWWWPRTKGMHGADLTPLLWHSRWVTGSATASQLYAKVPADWWTVAYGGWTQPTFLQFSSRATVAKHRIDVSAFRGSRDDLTALLAAKRPAPLPAPATSSPVCAK